MANHFITKRRALLATCMLCLASFAHANELQTIVQKALQKDPRILEAKADVKTAENRTEQAVSEHYPKLSVFGRQTVQQHHRYESNSSSTFNPGVEASVNLYSFGAIEKRVKQAKANEQATLHKFDVAQEQLAFSMIEIYLQALKAKETLSVLKQSSARIDSTLNEIDVIADNDVGRRSEYVQAQARKYAIAQQMNSVDRELKSAIGKLKRYTGHNLSVAKITDPFNKLTAQVLKTRFTRDKTLHPSYLASKEEINSTLAELEAQKAARFPKVDLVGQATKDDQLVYLNVSVDLYNRQNSYAVQENASRLSAVETRLDQLVQDLDERKELSLINLEQYKTHISTLTRQVNTQKEVIEFYKMQFSIAKRTLLELLNAENELLSAQLSKVNSEYELRHSILDYLASQGTLTQWAGVSQK
ncbi:TolC family protein [Pasteurellaceae bacterium HPA106]|uniref:TolC family protein n=1 Tax=Spirabiliibacterium pneumoniae TaxID=221400 RepID=UPI001AAC9531|nr:TolC family protein [Spirabiliibacterium pneumoniae]MBE2897017.1 TolC family protein [Spirabiliibacterium pneumoniae]